jgi:very-short-patch-repair endonuclease
MTDPSRKRNPPTDPVLLARARAMRHDPSAAEDLLWQALRGRKLGGFKFKRQKPADAFITDFHCFDAKLIVELDGSSHDGRELQDETRTNILERDGCRVIRFQNIEVFYDLPGVLAEILDVCEGRVGADGAARTTAYPHPGPLPGGEGERL